MKVLFVDPSGDVAGFNTGLGYLAAVLKRHGHTVKVIDCNNNAGDREQRLSEARVWSPDAVGLSIKTNTMRDAAAIAASFRDGARTIFAGGPGVTCERERFLADNPVYDYCFIGEAEESLPAVLNALERKQPPADVKGVCARRNGTGSCAEFPLIRDLDALPFPDYSVFDTVAGLPERYPLVTSRGCPYDCIYCSVNKISGRAWRRRSPGNVVRELKEAKEKYGITAFTIADDNFTMDIARAKEICRLMIAENTGLRWSCINGIRADRVDEELLALMKRSGCETVWFGIESLDEGIFDGIKKGEKLAAVTTAVRLAKKAGLFVCGFFIAGLPGSSYEKDRQSLARAKELALDEMLWSLATPYPHTEFWEWAAAHARPLADYRHTSFFKAPRAAMETDDYPAGRRLEMFYKGNLAGRSYSCFFSRKIGPGEVLHFFWSLIRYDAGGFLSHLRTILAGKYHRKYLREALKRIT